MIKEKIKTVRKTVFDYPELVQVTRCPACNEAMGTYSSAEYVRLNNRCEICDHKSDEVYQNYIDGLKA